MASRFSPTTRNLLLALSTTALSYEMDASPAKRRVLASLDPNASPKPQLRLKHTPNTPGSGSGPGSPLKHTAIVASDVENVVPLENPEPKKRPAGIDDSSEELPTKKPRLDVPPRSRENVVAGTGSWEGQDAAQVSYVLQRHWSWRPP